MVSVIPFWLIHTIALAILVTASAVDLRKREVPDLLNYSLVAIGIILAVISSVYSHSIWPFVASIIGVVLGYSIGAVMFYSGQWGGGDAKMLMGLGALLGFDIYASIEKGIETVASSLFVNVFVAILIAGVVYGLIYLLYLIIKKWKTFRKHLKIKLNTKEMIHKRWTVMITVSIGIIMCFLIADPFTKIIVASLAGLIFIGFYMFTYIKVVEHHLLTGPMKIVEITPGEWLSKDLFVKAKEQSPVKSIKQNMALYYVKEGPRTAKKKTTFINRKTKELIKKIVFETYGKGKFSFFRKIKLKLNKKTYEEFRKKIIFVLHLETEESFDNYVNKNELQHLKNILKKHHLVFKKRFISGPKDLGINEEQIKLLKKLKTRTILVKKGIPFIPAFFLAYVLVLILLNYSTTPIQIMASLV